MPVSRTTPPILSLEQIDTSADVDDVMRSLVPTPRFAKVSFESYLPDPKQPSQAAARDLVARFVADLDRGAGGGLLKLFRRNGSAPQQRGLYLDGGYGVGKTHLLAAAFHAAAGPKAYLSFAELTYLVGSLGVPATLNALRNLRLLCIDEFELDDVANTRIAATLLRGLFDGGSRVRVVTTSNTLPHQLGAGRFAAEDFKREIGVIASAFDVVRIDGDDYRHRPKWEGTPAREVVSPAELRERCERYVPTRGAKVYASFPDLLQHLGRLHPIRYARLLEPIEAMFIEGLAPIQDQSAALQFVHLVDKLYDQQVHLVVSTTCDLPDLFLPSYRDKGYAKKYQRCLSRLHELLEESAGARFTP